MSQSPASHTSSSSSSDNKPPSSDRRKRSVEACHQCRRAHKKCDGPPAPCVRCVASNSSERCSFEKTSSSDAIRHYDPQTHQYHRRTSTSASTSASASASVATVLASSVASGTSGMPGTWLVPSGGGIPNMAMSTITPIRHADYGYALPPPPPTPPHPLMVHPVMYPQQHQPHPDSLSLLTAPSATTSVPVSTSAFTKLGSSYSSSSSSSSSCVSPASAVALEKALRLTHAIADTLHQHLARATSTSSPPNSSNEPAPAPSTTSTTTSTTTSASATTATNAAASVVVDEAEVLGSLIVLLDECHSLAVSLFSPPPPLPSFSYSSSSSISPLSASVSASVSAMRDGPSDLKRPRLV
eukprot:ANDGO_01490.mRNA.2 hypothetical protein